MKEKCHIYTIRGAHISKEPAVTSKFWAPEGWLSTNIRPQSTNKVPTATWLPGFLKPYIIQSLFGFNSCLSIPQHV